MTKKQEVLLKIVERFGIFQAVKSTGLSLYEIYKELDGHLEFTPGVCVELLEYMFNNTSLLKQTDENISLDWGVFTDGICTWFYNNKRTGEKLLTVATPFWDGESSVPVNIEDYVVDKFERLSHLINWFNEVYFEDIKEVIYDGLKILRNNAKRKGV